MFLHGKDADASVQPFSGFERIAALQRIVPKRIVKEVLCHCRKEGTFCKRLPAWLVLWFVVALGLFSGESYRQVYRWLVRFSKVRGVPIRSTLCEARKRLGVVALIRLFAKVVHLLADPATTPGAFYRGMRLMALDGFVLNLPDFPALARSFGRPGTDRAPGAFPQARLLALCEAGTHLLWRVLIKPYRVGEITMAPLLLRLLKPGMLLLWDRNFFKYAHVKQVIDRGAQLLALIKSDVKLRVIKRLSDGSYLSKIYRSGYDRKHDRNGLLVRVIKYTLNEKNRPGHRQTHRLLTTLLDEKLDPAKKLIELYHLRWEQELTIDELKTHELARATLVSQTPAGVVQEIYALLIAHFIIRWLMHQAAIKLQISPLRLSFVGTLKILRCRLAESPRSQAIQRQWWQQLLEEIAQERIEPRRNRINPRVIKRKMSNWKKKRPEHLNYPQPLKPFSAAVVLLR
jgi:hypothetical protein